MTAVADQTLSTPEAADLAGVSYRQADYWVRTGLIELTSGSLPGYGRPRRWTEDEVAVLGILGRLSEAFGGRLDRSIFIAATVAAETKGRDWLGEPIEIELSPHVRLIVETTP